MRVPFAPVIAPLMVPAVVKERTATATRDWYLQDARQDYALATRGHVEIRGVHLNTLTAVADFFDGFVVGHELPPGEEVTEDRVLAPAHYVPAGRAITFKGIPFRPMTPIDPKLMRSWEERVVVVPKLDPILYGVIDGYGAWMLIEICRWTW